MPEKTRDRKSWFPRFKSNWLGTYRSKQMFVCCECGVLDGDTARYKGAEGKHCVCGKDQWHLAKSVEEAEYNRRMEISKAFGGLRYDDAVQRLQAMDPSANVTNSSTDAFERLRGMSTGSDCSSVQSMQTRSPTAAMELAQAQAQAQAPEPVYEFQDPVYESQLPLSLPLPLPPYASPNASPATSKHCTYATSMGGYTPVGVETAAAYGNQANATDQFGTYTLTEDDAMGFGDMLQDMIEDHEPLQQRQPRNTYYSDNAYGDGNGNVSPVYAASVPYEQPVLESSNSHDYYTAAYPASAYRDVYAMAHPFEPAYGHYAQPLTTSNF